MDATTINSIDARAAQRRQHAGARDGLVPASNIATLTPNAALANSANYTVTVRGGATDPRVKDAAGNALAAQRHAGRSPRPRRADRAPPTPSPRRTACTGNPSSEWDVSGAGDPGIQGYATQISVNRGSTVQFKVDTNATNYRFDIYRMGYYGGMGARKVTTVNPSATLPQNQPNCLTQASTGLIDCGNWAVSGSWAVPATATSGIYFAKVVRTRHGRRQPHRVHRARRREHLRHGVPDFGHHLAGLQQLRRQQPVHGLAGHQPGPRLQGELQPSVQHARGRRRPGLGIQRRIPDGPLARGQRL